MHDLRVKGFQEMAKSTSTDHEERISYIQAGVVRKIVLQEISRWTVELAIDEDNRNTAKLRRQEDELEEPVKERNGTLNIVRLVKEEPGLVNEEYATRLVKAVSVAE